MDLNSVITVVVRNKDKILFSGQAYAVTAINEKGPFDVLAEHENFISLIKDKIIVHKTPKEQLEIQIANGIVRVYKDKVYIYVNFKS
jgi:F0F1-type ATP synthase epsilon subunit